MRPAPSDRRRCEQLLIDEEWTRVKIFKSNYEPVAPYYEMLKWCDDYLGPGRVEPSQSTWLDDYDVWYSFTWYGYYNFYFKHKKDATAFSLRWA